MRAFVPIAWAMLLSVLVPASALAGSVPQGPSCPRAFDPSQLLLRSGDADGLPVVNAFPGGSGCYVACYAHHAGVYDVGPFGVHGLVRVAGAYASSERVCRPRAHEADDISALRSFKDLCNRSLPTCHGQCWAGGDTGGFFMRSGYVPRPAARVALRPVRLPRVAFGR